MKSVFFTIAALLLSTQAFASGRSCEDNSLRTNRDPAAEAEVVAPKKADRMLSADLEKITEGSSVITIDGFSHDGSSLPSAD